MRSLKKSTPYIIALQSTEKSSYIIVVEGEVLVTTEYFRSALLYLFAAYYTFNIAYPQLQYPVLILIQRYIMGLEDSQNIPKSVRQAVTVMKRL